MPSESETKHCITSLLIILQFVTMASGLNYSVIDYVDSPFSCNEAVNNFYNCREFGLYKLQEFDTTAIEVDFSYNHLETIFNTSFSGLRNLRILNLKQNNISKIEPYSFAELFRLQILDLSNNRLRNITEDIFSGLSSLHSLNLTNNRIVAIHHQSFFSSASLRELMLSGNELQCQCEEQHLKQHIEYRNAKSALKLNVQGALCVNYDNKEMFNITLDACTNGRHWGPVVQCYSCVNYPDRLNCDTISIASCGKNTDVCYSSLTYNNNSLSVTMGCMDYVACLGLIAKNNKICVEGDTQCYSCYIGSLSNMKDMAGFTNEFVLDVTVELTMNMTAELKNISSKEYYEFTKHIASDVTTFVKDEKVRFWVKFNKLSESQEFLGGDPVHVQPQVTVHLTIHCTTVWYVSTTDVRKALSKKLPSLTLSETSVTSVDIMTSSNLEYCPPIIERTTGRGQLYWPLTHASNTANIDCPFQFNNSRSAALRQCLSDRTWGSSFHVDCPLEVQQSRYLQEMVQRNVSNENVAAVSLELSTITDNWNTFTSSDMQMVVDTVDKILNTDLSITDDVVINNTVDTINNLLNIEDDVLAKAEKSSQSSARMILAIEKLLSRIDKDFALVKSNLAGFVFTSGSGIFNGLTLSLSDGFKDLTGSKINVARSAIEIGAGMSGIVLPPTLLNSSEKVTFTVYSDPKLFTSVTKETTTDTPMYNISSINFTGVERKVASKVLAASVPDRHITNLLEPVKVILNHELNGKHVSCVYWSLTASEWRSDGCSVHTTNEDYTECHCDHLTNFALLMDVYDKGAELSDSNQLALSIISMAGCALSLVGSLLTFVSYVIFRRIRKDNPSKILMQLCAAIAAVNLVFLAGVQNYSRNSISGCKTVAVLLHYFLLVIMCWMLVEAFYMYQSLVKVFDSYISRFQLKAAVFSWGTPLIIVTITLAVNKTDNYSYQPGGICWLDRTPFLTTFLAPVCLVFLLNAITYVLVMKQILRKSSSKLTQTEQSKTGVRLRGAASLLVLLGLTWSFAILAIGDAGIAFMYLFVICNSLQGFFVFVFYCLLREDIRKAWKSVLPCFKSHYIAASDSSGMNMVHTITSKVASSTQSDNQRKNQTH